MACFCQLSLLGWDDNPHYGNPLDKTAVQLWHQGLINRQEILCICPQSHMTDCTITDIRPIDQRNGWGPNNGGGDFLRYRSAGNNFMSKMCASRCSFENYGPLLGTSRYYMTSEDDAVTGCITANMVAADDIARVYFNANYTVQRDIDAEDLTLIWLGCPGYDKSRYAKYAWGVGDRISQDGLVEVAQGAGEIFADDWVKDNSWYAAYRGGIIDEQFREPNANKGLIYRGGQLHLSNHPHAQISAKRLRINAFDGLTTQYWIGLYSNGQSIHFSNGDTISVQWEYVPILKYATDYGLKESYSKVYLDILKQNPDSIDMLRYEAKHGLAKITESDGVIIQNSLFPSVIIDNEVSRFTLSGGSGWTPVCFYLNRKPVLVRLFELNENGTETEVAHRAGYQLEMQDQQWIATFLIKGAAESVESDRVVRKFILYVR